ncbi:hypothetical protein MPTK1_3g22810 [Marchantia polymorpha subsp. ruderalis]|uniref:Enkurin domain-containing protein n=2 Tax=Marchantia polymorpha TaxID=3197 RepID=A0AAF6B3Q8_MARPO|nr:hypothetical protein MARPO_0024s0058 [Marchantia polymorpha]BBN06642.1 hypothetical protein Mp_3g22810 [Marchantia polymorpha subsp. ruderalis]|eukprot:PTQ43541.1 hypothetical protein MARPO_0024s0058 [Marchantia polymorpha]
MSIRERDESADGGSPRHDLQYLSLNNDCHERAECPKPTHQRQSQELGPRELQELEGLEKYGLETPQSQGRSPLPASNNDSQQIHNLLDPSPGNGLRHGLALPQYKNKRTPYASHLDSYQIHNLLNPTRGIRDEMRRRGITPRNHHKANVAAIATTSAKLHNIRNGIAEVDPPDGRTSRLRNSRSDLPDVYGRGERCETPDNASVMTSTTQQSKGKKNSLRIDYMARNIDGLATAAAAGRRKMSANVAEQKPSHENYGRVPAYLSRRKLELEEDRERRVQEAKEKHLPPGLVLMKNEERLEVLKTLEDNRDKLVNKLSGMPLVVETPTQIRSKGDLDAQLKEVEDSIKRFSRQRVYIRYSQ